jgi:hypothetical protein
VYTVGRFRDLCYFVYAKVFIEIRNQTDDDDDGTDVTEGKRTGERFTSKTAADSGKECAQRHKYFYILLSTFVFYSRHGNGITSVGTVHAVGK